MRPPDKWAWLNLITSKQGPSKPGVRLILSVMCTKYLGENTTCWPSQETLAADTGFDVRSVRRLLKDAQTEGWVVVTTRATQTWSCSKEYAPVVPAGLTWEEKKSNKPGGEIAPSSW